MAVIFSTVDELGLFPLNLVLLPGEQAPLHIFEPRYRELIGECLEDGKEFGLVLADDDGMRDVGTRAGVIEVLERFPDGRLNVVVEGRDRFRLVELTEGRSFATAEVDEIEDEGETPSDDEVEECLATRPRQTSRTSTWTPTRSPSRSRRGSISALRSSRASSSCARSANASSGSRRC
jgi:Lon protease-like protein